MLRVAMITDRLGDDFNDGGVQSVTRYLVNAMASRTDLDVHLVSFDYRAKSVSRVEKQGYTLHLIPGSRFGLATAYATEQRRVDAYFETLKPDIVHSQGAGHLGMIALRCKFPSIITIHGIMSEEAKYITNLRQKFRRWSVSVASEHLCIRRANNTILISPYVDSYYKSRLSGRRFQIPNPVSQTFFDLERAEEPGRILFAGRIYPLKGVSDLVDAVFPISKEIDIKLILAGALHDKRYVAELKKKISELGLDSVVEFRGVLDQKSLLREFQRASVMVLPSYQETAPMVIQEAMAAGLPVIATNVGGVPYQITDGKTGFLIEPGNSTTLTRRLRTVLNEPDVTVDVAKAARRVARGQFAANIIAQQTYEAYNAVLEDN